MPNEKPAILMRAGRKAPLWIFLVILFMEFYFRWVSPVFPDGGVGFTYSNHFKYGRNYFGYGILDPTVPNFFFFAGQRKFEYRNNSAGLRSDTELEEKKPGEFRILLLGGSFIYDIYTSQNEAWPLKLERELRRTRANVSVLNMGMPGVGIQHAMLKAQFEIRRIKPDIVLFSGIWNDMKYFHLDQPLTRLPLQGTSSVVRTKLIIKFVDFWFSVVRYSALLTKLSGYPVQMIVQKGVRSGIPPARGHVRSSAGPKDLPDPVGLRQYERTMEAFQALVLRMGAVPVLLVEPNFYFADRGEPNVPVKDFKDTLTQKGIRASIDAARALTLKHAGKGKPVLDFTERFAGNSSLLSDHIHVSELGGDVLAALLAKKLLPLIPLTKKQ